MKTRKRDMFITNRNIYTILFFIQCYFLYSPLQVTGQSKNVYIPAYTKTKASNENTPIVKHSNSKQVTHKLKIKNITIGFSDKGGGYINYCDLGDGKNICSPFYGRGWQHSIRDFYHNHRYNPTQAGFRDHEGAPVKLKLLNNSVIIPKFNLPLFSDPIFDFVEHEDIIKEHDKYVKLGKNKDNDGIKEAAKNGDDEIRSEWDFSGIYEDASSLTPNKIPTLRHRYYYAYRRSPSAVYQFGKNARMDDGNPVLNNNYALQDIAPDIPGKQTARIEDISYGQFTSGFRLLTKVRDLSVPWWIEKGKLVYQKKLYPATSPDWKRGKKQGGRWIIFNDKLPNQKNIHGKVVRQRLGGKKIDLPLMILADGNDPNKSMGIGLYVPLQSPINRAPIVGINKKTLSLAYTANRNMQHFFQGGQRVPIQYNLVERVWFTGLRAPTPKIFEAYYHEVFILFGSPKEIYTAVLGLEKYFKRK